MAGGPVLVGLVPPRRGRALPLHAVIFDLEALADVECGGHRLAFNAAFAAHGLEIEWSVPRYRKLMALRDERQRVAAELRARGICTECDVLAEVLVDEICATKAMMVDEMLLGANLDPRTGLGDLITEAFTARGRGWRGQYRPPPWVEPLVRQLLGDGMVQTIVTADDVSAPMASGDAYRLALAELGARAQRLTGVHGLGDGLRTAMSAAWPGCSSTPTSSAPARTTTACASPIASGCTRRLWARGNRSAAA